MRMRIPPAFSRLRLQFDLAFSLMSVIPLLICCYLITVKFYSIEILQGLNGVYFLFAVLFALLGLLAGRLAIRQIFVRLVEANQRLERLTEQQAAFVSNVAHEFRAPLAVIKGATDNLVDGLHGPLVGDQLEALMMCQRESGRLKRLVSDLLDLARMEVGKLPLARQEVVLQDLLRTTARMFEDQIRQRGLKLNVELPAERAGILCDQDRLQQVMINLLHNAIKFTQQGTITVRLTAEPQAYVIEVSDSGQGIAQGDLERVFDKFERVGAQTEEGSGLGLPIAKEIVELHHGRIWVESRLGIGSRFVVQLPKRSEGDAFQSPAGNGERRSGNGEQTVPRGKAVS